LEDLKNKNKFEKQKQNNQPAVTDGENQIIDSVRVRGGWTVWN
jgi:ribose 5-phosphate isomerase